MLFRQPSTCEADVAAIWFEDVYVVLQGPGKSGIGWIAGRRVPAQTRSSRSGVHGRVCTAPGGTRSGSFADALSTARVQQATS